MLNAALRKHVAEMQSLSSNRNLYNWFIIMLLASLTAPNPKKGSGET